MREILILRCSPHAGGVSDRLADYFAKGASLENYPVRVCSLREFSINPCDACGQCLKSPYKCRFHNTDDFSFLFSMLRNTHLAVFVSPIYFYALPSTCAAFIDRGQALWNEGSHGESASRLPPGIAIFAAGRDRGEKLFTGASLCLSCFFRSFGSSLLARYTFRALEHVLALEAKPRIKTFIMEKGRDWARYSSLNENP